ncbi:MAG: 16S rRNA (cytosine(967)-C(5))-methyltransferase RsmB [Gammaproteobacteria bacterium]|nr:16S rRNA (cytosine(967)-C(5))-methyltransferase RsmB [Gammaproteobacteria bacterium]NNE06906.1 16S rRNA (cytosine(967)-C(5))-methyltransferase RsmB [Xanthomonadales bacterium]
MSGSVQPRLLAIQAVNAVIESRQNLGEFFAHSPQDHRAFASHLAYGVLRWYVPLEWLAARLLNRPLKQRDRDVHYLLLTGLFQLWHKDGAEHAAVHASAECTRALDKSWATGLVNAVLRRFQRERETLLGELATKPEHHAHPAWLLERLQADWPRRWPEITDANNHQAPLWLRANSSRISVEDTIKKLEDGGFECQRHDQAREAIRVRQAVPVEKLPGFNEGLLSVQDPAAQLAAHYLSAEAGHRVLDACAAPGGKTSHILELEPQVKLLALDRNPDRMGLINENLSRLGLQCDARCADASAPRDWWDGQSFDRILLDAPCSATGVIRRHPEIRHLRTEKQVMQSVGDQKRLLHALWPLLKSGGILVYATCSVLKEENHEQIHEFLARYPEASLCGPGSGDGTGRQILPGEDEMDGFYYALIRKSD